MCIRDRGFERISLLDDAVEALVASEEEKKHYLNCANNVDRLYKAILPDPAGEELQAHCGLIRVLAQKIRALSAPVDISEIMYQVEGLLDRSIAAKGYIIKEGQPLVNLSQIDFESLKDRFERGRKFTELERVLSLIHI